MKKHFYFDKNLCIKAVSLVMAFVIVLSMFPVLNSDAAGKTVTMYVVTKITDPNGGGSTAQLKTFSYNKDGLVKKQKNYWNKKKVSEVITYKYNDNLMQSYSVNGVGKTKKTYKYSYNDENKVSEVNYTNDNVTYKKELSYDSDNRVKTITEVTETDTYISNIKFSFTYNKKNQISKIDYTNNYKRLDGPFKVLEENTWKQKQLITYDKKGNLKKQKIYTQNKGKYKLNHTLNYNNSYKKGRLIKKKSNRFWAYLTGYKQTIKYKKIKVPAAYKNTVKEQQKAILQSNEDTFSLSYNPFISW